MSELMTTMTLLIDDNTSMIMELLGSPGNV